MKLVSLSMSVHAKSPYGEATVPLDAIVEDVPFPLGTDWGWTLKCKYRIDNQGVIRYSRSQEERK